MELKAERSYTNFTRDNKPGTKPRHLFSKRKKYYDKITDIQFSEEQ